MEEALIEMYLAGVSARRVEDITEALWDTRVSPGTVSNLNRKIYQQIEAWRHRPIEGEHPYLYLDGIVLKRSWAGEVRNVSLLVAISVKAEGYRETEHFYRNVFSHVPFQKLREVALMLKAIYAQESRETARRKADEVVAKLAAMRLAKAAELVERAIDETLAYYAFPEEWYRDKLERIPFARYVAGDFHHGIVTIDSDDIAVPAGRH